MEEIKQYQKNPEQNIEQKTGDGKNLIFGLAIVVIFIVAFLGAKNWLAGIAGDGSNPANSAAPAQTETNNSGASTQVNGDPNTGVEITAVYEKEKSQNQTAFQLSFSTHVVDYSSYNFQENIVLRDDQNKEYKAVSVTKQGSGHHQSVEITFPLVSSPFKLIVKNLANVPERVFNF